MKKSFAKCILGCIAASLIGCAVSTDPVEEGVNVSAASKARPAATAVTDCESAPYLPACDPDQSNGNAGGGIGGNQDQRACAHCRQVCYTGPILGRAACLERCSTEGPC
jgi:hypothetical protein